MPYANGYLFRKLLTIDHTKISGGADLSNFPFRFSHTDPDLKSIANGGRVRSGTGLDVRIETTGGTKLDTEKVTWSATTGKITGVARIPTLTFAADPLVYMYLGNAAVVSSEDNATGLCTAASLAGLWHLPDGTTLSGADSSANANNLTNSGATVAAGLIDGAASFSGGSAFMGLSTPANLPATGDITVTALVNPSSFAQTGAIAPRILVRAVDSSNGYMLMCGAQSGANSFAFSRFIGGVETKLVHVDATWATNTWYYASFSIASGVITAVVGPAGSVAQVTDNSTDSGFGIGTGNTLRLGLRDSSTGPFSGLIDEPSVASVARTVGWRITESNNLLSPSTFYSVGALESSLIPRPRVVLQAVNRAGTY